MLGGLSVVAVFHSALEEPIRHNLTEHAKSARPALPKEALEPGQGVLVGQ
jgi:hypothetical protein